MLNNQVGHKRQIDKLQESNAITLNVAIFNLEKYKTPQFLRRNFKIILIIYLSVVLNIQTWLFSNPITFFELILKKTLFSLQKTDSRREFSAPFCSQSHGENDRFHLSWRCFHKSHISVRNRQNLRSPWHFRPVYHDISKLPPSGCTE